MNSSSSTELQEYSTPLDELPSFLSAISLVSDDPASIIRGLAFAERPSPARYEAARDLFCRALERKFTYRATLTQARSLADSVERDCAVQVLVASENFLTMESSRAVRRLPVMTFPLPNGLNLAIKPVWLREDDPPRVMVLHFWATPLTRWQLSAAGVILKDALKSEFPEYGDSEIDFVSVSVPRERTERKFDCFNWENMRILDRRELARFVRQLCDAWAEYKARPPRPIIRKRAKGLFD